MILTPKRWSMRAKLAVQSNGFTIKRDQTADRRLQLGLACLTGHFARAHLLSSML
jgi:hypothetical protein